MSAAQWRSGSGQLWLLVLAVVLVGLTLRSPIVGIPPLLNTISADLEYSATTAALLTSLPLLAFALLSPVVPLLMRVMGVDFTLVTCLVILGSAIVTRPWVGGAGLLVGTMLVGAAITMGNVVIPVLVRRDAGQHVPRVIAASTSAYGLGQALAAFTAVPLAVLVGWRWSITFPAMFVVLALVVCLIRIRTVLRAGDGQKSSAGQHPNLARVPRDRNVWLEGGAWWLALFFGMQSLLFYTGATWIPAQLTETGGLGEATAGTALSLFHVVGIAGTLLVPALLRHVSDARWVGVCVGLGWFIFFAGLQMAPGIWPLLMVWGGLVQGAGIGLGLTLIATRPGSSTYGRHLSGMVQGVGYAVAALGPVVVGVIRELTTTWWWSTAALLLCAALMMVAAWRTGEQHRVAPPDQAS